jgi:hypothetical protein
VLFLFVLISCEIKTTQKTTENQKETKSVLNEDFYEFIEKFSTDMDFQLTRIEFPYQSEYLDYDSNNEDHIMYNDFISKDKHKHLNFSDLTNPSSTNEECTIHAEIAKTKAMIVYLGIDNGIHNEFYFLIKKGKWYYDGNSDSSM